MWFCTPRGPQQHLLWTFTDGITLSMLLHQSEVQSYRCLPIPLSLTQQFLLIVCISLLSSSSPLSVAEQQPFPWRGTSRFLSFGPAIAVSGDHHACVGCNDHGTAFYLEYLWDTGSLFGFASCLFLACLALSAQPPPTSEAGRAFRNGCLGEEPTF